MTKSVKKAIAPLQCNTKIGCRVDAATLWSNMVSKSLSKLDNDARLAMYALRKDKLQNKITESNKIAAEKKGCAKQAKPTACSVADMEQGLFATSSEPFG